VKPQTETGSLAETRDRGKGGEVSQGRAVTHTTHAGRENKISREKRPTLVYRKVAGLDPQYSHEMGFDGNPTVYWETRKAI
jgi:hypothetical protein